MLYVDKYRPRKLDKLTYHEGITKQLATLASKGDFAHLLFYGPPGAGKKTRALAFLREVYGPGTEKLRTEHKEFTAPSGRKIEISTLSSAHHLEVNPSDVGVHDRVVVQEVIKEIASSAPLDAGGQGRAFKVIVLQEVERLSRDAQQALRRTMEKYSSACRLLLISTSNSRVIEPVRSRCLGVRVGAPSDALVVEALEAVARRESLKLAPEVAAKIAEMSGGNLRRALLCLEGLTAREKRSVLDRPERVPLVDWEAAIRGIARDLIEEQSPERILKVRTKFYDLLARCIPPQLIMRVLALTLLESCDGAHKLEVLKAARDAEHNMQLGSKPIFHLEAFAVKFMAIHRKFILSLI